MAVYLIRNMYENDNMINDNTTHKDVLHYRGNQDVLIFISDFGNDGV